MAFNLFTNGDCEVQHFLHKPCAPDPRFLPVSWTKVQQFLCVWTLGLQCRGAFCRWGDKSMRTMTTMII